MVRFDPSDVGRGGAGGAEEDGMKDVSRTRKRKRHATETTKKTKKTTETTETTTETTTTEPATNATTKPTKCLRVEDDSWSPELPADVWMIICERVCHDVDEEKMTKMYKSQFDINLKKMYKNRFDTLLAMRQTCSMLRHVLSGEFGEELFRSAFDNLAIVYKFHAKSHGDAPASMLWRHKAWILRNLQCQVCNKDAHQPTWTFGVRMCKGCLMERTVYDDELKRDKKWTRCATYKELTAGLANDEVQQREPMIVSSFAGGKRRWKVRVVYTGKRFWKAAVKERHLSKLRRLWLRPNWKKRMLLSKRVKKEE